MTMLHDKIIPFTVEHNKKLSSIANIDVFLRKDI